jgi:regulator of protease activity HflC (stomatin/prohibitin superfamily)
MKKLKELLGGPDGYLAKWWRALFPPPPEETRSAEGGEATTVTEKMPARFIFLTALIYLNCVIAAVILRELNFLGNIMNWPLSAAYLIAIHIGLSVRRVGPREIGMKEFFGEIIQNLGSGLTFAPWGISSVVKSPKTLIHCYIGQELDRSGTPVKPRATATEVVLASNAPFRVTFASYDNAVWTIVGEDGKTETEAPDAGKFSNEKTAKGDPLNHRLTTDPQVAVWFRIEDPKRFYQTVGDLEHGFALIEKAVVATLSEYCARRTPSFVLAHLANAVRAITKRVEALIGDPDIPNLEKGVVRWGIDLMEIRIPSLGIDYGINKAMVEARKASYNKRAAEETGRGEAIALQANLEAQAAGTRARLEAEAAGLKAKTDALNSETGRLLARLEALVDAFKHGNVVVTSENNPLGLLPGVKAVWETQGEGKSPSGPQPPAPAKTGSATT